MADPVRSAAALPRPVLLLPLGPRAPNPSSARAKSTSPFPPVGEAPSLPPRSAAALPFSQIRRSPALLPNPPPPYRAGWADFLTDASTPRRAYRRDSLSARPTACPARGKGSPSSAATRRSAAAAARRREAAAALVLRRPQLVRRPQLLRRPQHLRRRKLLHAVLGMQLLRRRPKILPHMELQLLRQRLPTIVQSMVAWICSFSCGARNFFSTWKPLHKSMVNILCLTKL